MRTRTLSADEARALYDRFGERQDHQGWYEDAALEELVRHGDFAGSRAPVEFGCGTGRFAAMLLEQHLPQEACYLGFDLSATMVELARRRLARFGERARVEPSDGGVELPLPDGSRDRYLSTYVFDLLSEDAVLAALADAHRLLAPGGRLCLAGLGRGASPLGRLVSSAWSLVHRLRPASVGGCRPLDVYPLLDPERWRVIHHGKVAPYGLTSEVLVAERLP